MQLGDHDKAALHKLDGDVVRPADGGRNQLWLTLKFPRGEKLDVRARTHSDFHTKLAQLLPAVYYYNLKRHWRKVRRHIEHPQVQALLVRDFNRCTWGRWRIITSKSRVSHHYPIDENKGVYDLLQPTNPNINLVVRKVLYPV